MAAKQNKSILVATISLYIEALSCFRDYANYCFKNCLLNSWDSPMNYFPLKFTF